MVVPYSEVYCNVRQILLAETWIMNAVLIDNYIEIIIIIIIVFSGMSWRYLQPRRMQQHVRSKLNNTRGTDYTSGKLAYEWASQSVFNCLYLADKPQAKSFGWLRVLCVFCSTKWQTLHRYRGPTQQKQNAVYRGEEPIQPLLFYCAY